MAQGIIPLGLINRAGNFPSFEPLSFEE